MIAELTFNHSSLLCSAFNLSTRFWILDFILSTGNFSPITGAFITADNAGYVYTGVQAQYKIGALNITPSFMPGLYHQGDGKDLGSVLEFKSEIKVGLDILESSKLSYSYSHISNNEWGDSNPGTDNQQITFSKNF